MKKQERGEITLLTIVVIVFCAALLADVIIPVLHDRAVDKRIRQEQAESRE